MNDIILNLFLRENYNSFEDNTNLCDANLNTNRLLLSKRVVYSKTWKYYYCTINRFIIADNKDNNRSEYWRYI